MADGELLESLRSIVWPHGGGASAEVHSYRERNGRIKEQVDRGQRPSFRCGESDDCARRNLEGRGDTQTKPVGDTGRSTRACKPEKRGLAVHSRGLRDIYPADMQYLL